MARKLNNRGQATAGEIILIVLLFALLGVIGWYELTKKTQSNKFEGNSRQNVYNYQPGGIRLFDFSCARKGLFDESMGRKN